MSVRQLLVTVGQSPVLAIKLREKGIDLMSLQRSMETSAQLQDVDLAMTNPLPLLFQMGYLTIKGYDRTFDEYSLGYPNREVKESFLRLISMIQNDQPEDMT